MSYFKRFLLRGSISVVLLAGLLSTFAIGTSSTAFARANACNTTATYSWSNNCTISEGNISNFVYAIQETIDESFAPCLANIDGDFGPQTLAVVKCFQAWSGFPPNEQDGIVGPKTWAALQNTLTFSESLYGWVYYYGQTSSKYDSSYRESNSDGGWQIYITTKGVWCTMNYNHC